MLCHASLGEYFFDSCAWDGTEVATATAGYDTLTTITSHPDHLCGTAFHPFLAVLGSLWDSFSVEYGQPRATPSSRPAKTAAVITTGPTWNARR